jgi:hypothetical protein
MSRIMTLTHSFTHLLTYSLTHWLHWLEQSFYFCLHNSSPRTRNKGHKHATNEKPTFRHLLIYKIGFLSIIWGRLHVRVAANPTPLPLCKIALIISPIKWLFLRPRRCFFSASWRSHIPTLAFIVHFSFFSIYNFTHLLTHHSSLTHHSLTHLLTYSLTHLLTYSLTHLLTHSLTSVYCEEAVITALLK